jgi:hypothetical protein
MGPLAERIISDLRDGGLLLDDVRDGWFNLHGESSQGQPGTFLFLLDSDIAQYLNGMRAEDVDGVFARGLAVDEARYRLTLVHLEEFLTSYHSGVRYVVIDGTDIRVFDTDLQAPPAPGDYEWRA